MLHFSDNGVPVEFLQEPDKMVPQVDIIRKHAELSGFPATKITLVERMIDPTTASA